MTKLHPILILIALTLTPSAHAIEILFDYTYDLAGNQFFSSNPAAKEALNAAAAVYENILTDSLAPIPTPQPGTNWQAKFFNPEDPITPTFQYTELAQTNLTVDQNQIRIFAGSSDFSVLGPNTLGIGGPGYHGPVPTTGTFGDNIRYRSQPQADFTIWGGAISFNNTTNFNFDYANPPNLTQHDFFAVALHELAHVLGISTAPQWQSLTTNISARLAFTGPAATAEFGGDIPQNPSRHWYQDSTVFPDVATYSPLFDTTGAFNTFIPTQSAMNPTIINKARPLLTILDAAALTDIGWEIPTLPTPPQPADIDRNRILNPDDLALLNNAILALNIHPFDLDGDNHTDAINSLNFDLNNDLSINEQDGTAWLNAFNTAPGDFNFDGRVNIADLIIWAQNFGTTNATYVQGDANFSSQINIADLITWAQNFGSTPPAPLNQITFATAIPEPSSAILLTLLLTTSLTTRRRHKK